MKNIIISIDRRWENELDYINMGFILIEETSPKCFYINKNNFKRNDCNIDNDFYTRIWDCGNLVFKLEY